MDGLDNLSEVEKLKLLKSIRIGCATEDEFSGYIEKFARGKDPVEVRRRVEGYFLEDEFSLFCFLNQCCTSVTPLGQSPVGNDSLKIPDYLVTFDTKNGQYPCFVEVKTTAKYETSKLSNNMLSSYKRFADQFNLPLYFASRIQLGVNGLWILQSSGEFEANGRSASIELYPKTCGFALLNDFALTIIVPFDLELQYSDSVVEGAILHEGLGYLTGVVAHTDAIVRLNGVKDENTVGSISFSDLPFLNIIFDRFSANDSTRRCEYGTTITRHFSLGRTEFISSLLVAVNKQLSDSDGVSDAMNASRFLAKIENGESGYINRQKLLFLINEINRRSEEVISQPLIGFGELGEVGDRQKHLDNIFKKERKK
jgi:hypothetical protein